MCTSGSHLQAEFKEVLGNPFREGESEEVFTRGGQEWRTGDATQPAPLPPNAACLALTLAPVPHSYKSGHAGPCRSSFLLLYTTSSCQGGAGFQQGQGHSHWRHCFPGWGLRVPTSAM